MHQWQLQTQSFGSDQGIPLVLIHSLGASHVVWDDIIPFLDPSLRVITVDLPGHGDSPCVPLPAGKPLRPEDLCRAIVASLDEAGVGSFHYAGVSLGGLLGYALADMCGFRMRSLTVMSSQPRNGSHEMWEARARDIREQGTDSILEATMERWFTRAYARGEGHQSVARVREAYRRCEDEGYTQCCEVLGRLDTWPTLATLALPILLVSGNEDDFSWERADEIAEHLRSGECPRVDILHLVGKHMCPMEHAEEVARALSRHALSVSSDE